MEKPGSETAIPCGAAPIPISGFSIQHAGNSIQRSKESIPVQPAVTHGFNVMGMPKPSVDKRSV